MFGTTKLNELFKPKPKLRYKPLLARTSTNNAIKKKQPIHISAAKAQIQAAKNSWLEKSKTQNLELINQQY